MKKFFEDLVDNPYLLPAMSAALGMLILGLVLFLVSVNANADTYIYGGGWNYHNNVKEINFYGGKEYHYNRSQHLLAIEHNGYMVGHMTNSYGNPTWLATKRFNAQLTENIQASLYIGATYGYHFCTNDEPYSDDKKTCAIIMPSLSYTKYRIEPVVTLFQNGAGLAFRYRW